VDIHGRIPKDGKESTVRREYHRWVLATTSSWPCASKLLRSACLPICGNSAMRAPGNCDVAQSFSTHRCELGMGKSGSWRQMQLRLDPGLIFSTHIILIARMVEKVNVINLRSPRQG